jgi:CubicO group peptidase (beta-lactamase class C family)
MRRSTFLLLILTILSCPGIAQPAVTSKQTRPVLSQTGPPVPGYSNDRLHRIDKAIQQYVDSQWIAGAAAMIVHNGKIVYYKGLGYDDVEKKTPLKRDAIFRIASQTKAITSTAVMMLYEEGKFLLDDPISKYIPEFAKPKVLDKFNDADSSYTTVAAKREITIRDLLTHTSGIDYAEIGSKSMRAIYSKAGIPSGLDAKDKTLGPEIRKLGSLPLAHQPGERWTYGLNTDVLGYLVELTSGMTLNDFFEKRIFSPLGMKDTYFYIPAAKHHRLATLNTEDSLQHLAKAPESASGLRVNYPNLKGTYYSGGGGLSSTMYDYAIFLQMLLNGGEYGGKRILSPHTVRIMTMNQIGDVNFGVDKFGLGFSITTEKGSGKFPSNEGTFEWGGYFGTSYWADPKEKIVALIMTQQVPNSHGDLGSKFKALVYQALE